MKFKPRLLLNKHLQKVVGLIVLDIIVFGLTNARNVPSLFLIVGFAVLILNIYVLSYYLIALIKLYGIKFKHQRRLALIVSGIVGCLIALQSVGELSLRDAAVLVPLGLLAYLYISYGAKRQKS